MQSIWWATKMAVTASLDGFFFNEKKTLAKLARMRVVCENLGVLHPGFQQNGPPGSKMES
jgi:hypothetical protein